MKKIALVYEFDLSNWKSSQSITRNLLKCYELNTEVVNNSFDLKRESTSLDLLELVNQIIDFKPNLISFIDHQPHPFEFLNVLHQKIGSDDFKKFEFHFHVFGDFTLFPFEWSRTQDLIYENKCKFICASDRQVNLIKSFIKDPENKVFKLPFPVDTNEFHFSQKIRTESRENFGFKDDEIIFLYTGRMSLQKNISLLILDFVLFLKITNSKKCKLVMAGPFDDIGVPYLGQWFQLNEFYFKYLTYTEYIGEEYKDQIFYIGNLQKENLLKLYNSADVYVSLSTYHDEDFGMAPAEAMCCGLPLILTDWAGYSNFYQLNKDLNCLIGIEKSQLNILPNRKQFVKSLILNTHKIENNLISRPAQAQIAKKYLSIEDNAIKLKDLINISTDNFDQFSSQLETLKKCYEESPPFFSKKLKDYSEEYSEIYQAYYQD